MHINDALISSNLIVGHPLFGMPGCLDVANGFVRCRVALHPALRAKHPDIYVRLGRTGGLSHLKILRSARHREKQEMILFACDTMGAQEVELAKLDWLSDEECEAWIDEHFGVTA